MKLSGLNPFWGLWTRKTAVGLACAVLPMLSHANPWVWLDESGRKVFSDTPPPQSVPDKRILQQPGRPKMSTAAPAAPEAQAPAATASKKNSASASATPDPAALKKQREAEQAAAAEKQAKEQKNAQVRADNCRRAQSALSTLQSGVRLVTTDEQGQRVVYDDAMRAAESSRLQNEIQANCY